MELEAQAEPLLLFPCPFETTSTALNLTVKRSVRWGLRSRWRWPRSASLRIATTPSERTLAQSIIELAQHGERDPDRLCEGALQAVSPAVQRDSPPVQPE